VGQVDKEICRIHVSVDDALAMHMGDPRKNRFHDRARDTLLYRPSCHHHVEDVLAEGPLHDEISTATASLGHVVNGLQ